MGRTRELLQEICDVHNQLSPENLYADGERSEEEVIPLRISLTAKLDKLSQEYGCYLTCEEAYERLWRRN